MHRWAAPQQLLFRGNRLSRPSRSRPGVRLDERGSGAFASGPASGRVTRMAFESFGDFVRELESAGELVRIRKPLATELEITELADREMKKPGGGQALLIEKPTIAGQVSKFPVAITTFGSARRMAMSLRASSVDAAAAELGSLMKARPPTGFREALKLLGTALDLRHAKPKMVKHGPCKEVIHKFDETPTAAAGKDPTLLDLPILRCWPLDGGRFITLPCVVTRDPDTGERNVGMYRIQIYDG